MKGFFKAIASLTLFATALAALVYYLEKLGFISIDYTPDNTALKPKEIDFPRGKTIFRSSEHNVSAKDEIEEDAKVNSPTFDFQFAEAE